MAKVRASEEPSESASSSETQLRIVVPKGAKSPLWTHFGFEVDSLGKKVNPKAVRCKHCKKDVTYCNNTTNLKQHMEKWHPGVLAGPSAGTSSTQTTMMDYSKTPATKLAPTSKRAQSITNALAEFIAKDMRPVATVEGQGFLSFVSALEPGYQVPSRKSVMKVIHDMYQRERGHVMTKLGNAAWVALTGDFWTSLGVKSYLGVTAHFITPDWQLMDCVLQTREMEESHTAQHVAERLQAVVVEWGVTRKLAGFTHDNARNLVAALRTLKWPHVPCVGHTLQIAVHAGLQVGGIQEILAKCRKIVGHFHHSYVAQSALEIKQTRLALPSHKLVQSVSTRWNSTEEMITRLLEQQSAVSSVLMESKKRSDRELVLTASEITDLEHIESVLEPFIEATTMVSGEKGVTISLVQPILAALQKKHLLSTDSDPPIIQQMKRAIQGSIEAHFSDEEERELMLISSSLDPRFKGLKFLPSSRRGGVYQSLVLAAAQMQATEEEAPEVPPAPKRKKGGGGLLDFADSDSSNGSSPSVSTMTMVEKEVTQYRGEEEAERTTDPLNWWKLNEHRYRILSELARKVLCLPATSVPSERLFSAAGNIVSSKRSCLKPQNVDIFCFLSKNL